MNQVGIVNLTPDFKINLEQFYNTIKAHLKIDTISKNKKQNFKAIKEKVKKTKVRFDLTNKMEINNPEFIEIFMKTYNYYIRKIKN